VILLSPGPFRLLGATDLRWKAAGCLLLALGLVLIALTGKRSTFWTIVAMGLFWIYFRAGRRGFLMAMMLVTLTLLVPKGLNFYRSLDRNIPSHLSLLQRLELYPFALHVYLQHPVGGIGLRSFTHEKYLTDFQPYNPNLQTFQQSVKDLQTFDNMLLTAFVELGTPMTLAYLALIAFIICKYCQRLGPLPRSPGLELYRLLVVLGFAVHSLTYDSMLFPSVNWLFHVQLAILAGYALDGASGSVV
jgi:O-antigen ligase